MGYIFINFVYELVNIRMYNFFSFNIFNLLTFLRLLIITFFRWENVWLILTEVSRKKSEFHPSCINLSALIQGSISKYNFAKEDKIKGEKWEEKRKKQEAMELCCFCRRNIEMKNYPIWIYKNFFLIWIHIKEIYIRGNYVGEEWFHRKQ